MQCLKIEDQVQLANILKQPVQRLNKNLYEIKKRERRLGGGADENEIEGCVVAVGDQGGGVVVGGAGGGRGGRGSEERRETVGAGQKVKCLMQGGGLVLREEVAC